ncbi:hypothetical protein Tco_1022435 [Tanacetum coccineum]
MESVSAQVVDAAKLPEVILNGNSPLPTRTADGVETSVPPTTAEHKLAWKNELKARGTQLMALPNEHQLKFNTYKSAKTQMEAIEKSTNEAVKTAHDVSAANSNNNASTLPNVDSLSDAVIYSFFSRDRLKVADGNADNESKEISQEDMKESRAHKNQDSRNKETTTKTMPVEETTSNALVSQCDGFGLDTEVSTCSKACLKSYETLKEHYDNLTKDFNKSQLNVGAYKTGLESVEARLDAYKKNEAVFEEDIKILKLDIMFRDNALTELRKKFEKAKIERDD